jgi:hypothetical protein
VSAVLCRQTLGDGHALTVDYVEHPGLPDRHVRTLAPGVEPDGFGLAGNRQARRVRVVTEIKRYDHASLARHDLCKTGENGQRSSCTNSP